MGRQQRQALTRPRLMGRQQRQALTRPRLIGRQERQALTRPRLMGRQQRQALTRPRLMGRQQRQALTPAKRSQRQSRDRDLAERVYSSQSDVFTGTSKTGRRAKDALERRLPCIRPRFWSTCLPRCWNWQETPPRI